MAYGVSILGLLLAVCLAGVHIFASQWRWLATIPRRYWVSLAGGISIAYIFLEVLPELAHAQTEVEHSLNGESLLTTLDNHIYLLALGGLALFYGLEKQVIRSRRQNQQQGGAAVAETGIFWIHIAAFAVYNAILGYLFRESANHGIVDCLILFVALSVHFVVNDVALRESHQKIYDHIGRWLLSAAILVGWSLGQVAHFNEAAVAVVWATVAGGVILNVLKEELPESQNSNFGLFTVGIVFYAVILLAT